METNQIKIEELLNSGECDLTTMELKEVTIVWKLQCFSVIYPPNENISLPKIITLDIIKDKVHQKMYGTVYLKIISDHNGYNTCRILFSMDKRIPTYYFFNNTYSFFDCETNKCITRLTSNFSMKAETSQSVQCDHKFPCYMNFTLVCKILYGYHKTKTIDLDIKYKTFESNNYKCNCMKILINDYGLEIPDLYIATKDNCTIKMHSSFLDGASTTYQSMITLNDNGKLLSLPYDRVTVLEMVRFIYTGEIDNIRDVALDLFDMAHTLDLTEIKNVCVLYFNKNISIENVVDIFTLANKWNVDLIRTKTLQFMKNNYTEICETEKLKNLKLSVPDLCEKILTVLL